MREIGILEAKTHLSALLSELEATGEPIVITRHGRAVARLVPERARAPFTAEMAEAVIRWRQGLEREVAESAQPFDWKSAVQDGRE